MTPQEALSLQWNTQFTSQGQTNPAEVFLNGDGTGTYNLNDGSQGSLFGVSFIPATNTPGVPASAGTYVGSWALSGQTGSFEWTVFTLNFTAFNGRFLNSTTGESNSWNGFRTPPPLSPFG